MKYSFKISTKDQNMQIRLNSEANLSGYDDDVMALIDNKTDESINDISDGEKRRFLPSQSLSLNFLFFSTGGTYTNKVAQLDFPSSGTTYKSVAMRQSFYVVQVYDSVKEESQLKLHTGYYNGNDFTKYTNTSIYPYNLNLEYTNLYFRTSYLAAHTGNTHVYVKFSFYSAKSGKIYPFYNLAKSGSTTEDRLYFDAILVPSGMTYYFSGITNTLYAKEIVNSQYVTFINTTVDSLSNQKPVYPSGNTFTDSGQYVTQV
jgi:hypothetical protein